MKNLPQVLGITHDQTGAIRLNATIEIDPFGAGLLAQNLMGFIG